MRADDLTKGQQRALCVLAEAGTTCVSGNTSDPQLQQVHRGAADGLVRLGLATKDDTKMIKRYRITEAGRTVWLSMRDTAV